MKKILFLIFALCYIQLQAQVNYVAQLANFNGSQTTNTTANYIAGTANNTATEVKTYATNIGDGSGYIGDPGVALFHTFTTTGVGSGPARPMKVGDQFSITCYVANSSSFFNNSNCGISFNGSTTYNTFSNFNTNQRAKFQINKNGAWFPSTGVVGNGFANAGQDVTFTIKLTSVKTAILTISSANGATTYDAVLNNSPSAISDNIQSFAFWNQTSGPNNDMYWKNGVLTSTGTVEIGNGNGSSTFDGIIANGLAANSKSTISVNSVTKSGTGVITLTAANTYTGSTTIAGGELRLNPAANYNTASSFIIQGGTTLSTTGIASGRSITSTGTLNLGSGTATLALASGVAHSVTFGDSSGVTWNGTGLTITGWGGIGGQGNVSGGKIYVGVNGLTLAQRQKITFQGYVGTPIILNSGELVPPGPNFTVSGSLTHGNTCVGVPSSTITYTITNTGGNATGVSIISGNPEFVISNLSSATINGAGGAATYQVTFTPSTGGARSGNISILTSTPNSNSPVISTVTGIGDAISIAPTGATGATSICIGGNTTLTVDGGIAGTGATALWYTGSCGGTPAGNGNDITVSPTETTTYYVRYSGICNTTTCATVTVTVYPLPTATISGTTTVCRNGTTPLITFTGAAAAAPYTFTYKINGGADLTATTVAGNSVTVSAPTGTAGMYTYSLVSVSSANACVNNQSGSAAIAVDAGTTYYADTDNDTYGDPASSIVSCTGQPAGYVTNNTDCAPADPFTWRNGNFYIDGDNDGYYNGNEETSVQCYGATTPSGYVASILGTDCDDDNVNTNPNHVEIAGNSIDDNCDGTIDEVGPAITIIISQCGITLNNIANTIYSNQATSALGYRFEVTNGATVRTYDSATSSFSLMNLAGGVTYGTTYAIRVAVKTNGLTGNFWRNYSGSCNITTPAVPATTNVVSSQCGGILANIGNLIYVNQVTTATQYRFEVTSGANVRTYESAFNRFSFSNFAGGATFGTTYIVRVALLIGGVWQDYGAACNVTTPATPGITNVIASQCGITISNTWTSIYVNMITGAQGYRFEVNDGTTVRFYNSSVNRFALRNVASMPIVANNTYTIRVAVLYNLVYGDFGTACTVSTGPAITRPAALGVAAFDVKAYPNPFAAGFMLNVETAAEDKVTIKVYDMLGRQVEAHQFEVADLTGKELGNRYPAGVYNVIISQGNNVKTLRIIKR